ncbi:MAG: hypothetical protein PHS49_07330 [Candidatus Gracilibacteria bacterium]|nr:hypothetical protein [Candidatus Gracilibacteria bacterium]
MNKQFENLTTALSKEILAFQGNTRIDYVREDIENILTNNGDIHNGIRDFGILASDLKNYVDDLPSNLANQLVGIRNLAMAIIDFKEEKVELSYMTEENNIEEEGNFYVPANIEY